jgi:hypothetical protein
MIWCLIVEPRLLGQNVGVDFNVGDKEWLREPLRMHLAIFCPKPVLGEELSNGGQAASSLSRTTSPRFWANNLSHRGTLANTSCGGQESKPFQY